MPPTVYVPLISACVGLFGVLFGLWLGQRRWRIEQEQKAEEQYRKDKCSAYLELWDVVDDAYNKIRSTQDTIFPEDFSGILANVNRFLMRKSVFLEPVDTDMVFKFLFYANEFVGSLLETRAGREYMKLSLIYDGMPTEMPRYTGNRSILEEHRSLLRLRISNMLGHYEPVNSAAKSALSVETRERIRALAAEARNTRSDSYPHDYL